MAFGVSASSRAQWQVSDQRVELLRPGHDLVDAVRRSLVQLLAMLAGELVA